ncbi:energy-coupling factor ABC transporter ATP-binding protein [Megamonas funiformis]|jgi:cobalt/nickel transport system ATP-binding protein|uniref:energy-coupling factor ABC transporter ATP-binding protein n=1 Tax=Megamonas funiformis TaxID=437897 RepID=UPI000E4A56E8|nr:ABC transporter ATP-binding protein [Megamonas funiformis]RHG06610.1 ABC transporter ATP-binding protein [Megamonas funiformis]
MTPIINLSHISYNYEEVSALNDISLEIYAGELIFFTGPNGCGKSTLFKLLNGLIFPTKGEYYFDNKKIDKNTLQDNISAKSFHKRIGYIFQNPDVQLFNATVYDEIAFGPRQMNLDEEIIHQRVNELLIYLNIQHLQDRPPYHLSGGEQKKVALAAILALNPDILMIDEPLNGLDNKTRQWFKDFLIDFIKANKTILISTHEQELLSLPHSRIIKFNDEHTILN